MDDKNTESNPTNEDDDYGSYFLQPASSPYNIAEKVQQANYDLFNNALPSQKTSKVKFKEELATYEPDLTDDDVNSIESDVAEIESRAEVHPQVLEYKTCNIINLNIFDINEEPIIEELEEEIETDHENEVEEIINDSHYTHLQYVEQQYNGDHAYLALPDTVGLEINSDSASSRHLSEDNISNNNNHADNNNLKKDVLKKPKPKHSSYDLIECKNHCIERLDCNLSMSIKKLELQEKPFDCPLLKLQRRKCCTENKNKNPQNLPSYNGLRSEYGLSSTALEKREKLKEINRLKEQKRQQLLQEYKNRKNQQNEEVFCQWLKDVARRKERKQKIENKLRTGSAKQPLSPNIINFPTSINENSKCRPHTANGFIPKQTVKKPRRPHTSACVFIEVPYKLLQKGVQIGDLLVTNSKFSSKNVHIMTVAS